MPDSLEATVLTHLRAFPGKRFTRADLVYRMKTCGFDATDRQVRKAIENLRASDPEGGRICSSSDEPGYWYSQREAEIQEAQSEDLSRRSATDAKIANRSVLLRQLEQERTMEGRLF